MKISIAMAVYNGERFIQEQLDSFVRQTRLPDELVISDGLQTVARTRKFSLAGGFRDAPISRLAYASKL